MSAPLRWAASPELTALLQRYYGGAAELWPQIQAAVAADLRARGLAAAPYHMRFRRSSAGYQVIIEQADEYSSG